MIADQCIVQGGGILRFEDYYIIPKSVEFFVLTKTMFLLLAGAMFVAGFALAFIWIHTRVEREILDEEKRIEKEVSSSG